MNASSAVNGKPPPMGKAAIEARRLTLIRFERAAGAAFGCDDDTAAASSDRLARGTIALAALAVALAAAIACLV